MRPIRGSVSPRRKIYPPKSCSSSTKKLTLLLPILRSSRELPNSEPAHFPARLPTSASSSQMKPRSGARRYVPPTSNRSKPPSIFHKSCSANGGGSKNGGRPSPGRGGVRNFYRVLFGLSAKFPNVCKSLSHGNYPKPGTTIAIDGF